MPVRAAAHAAVFRFTMDFSLAHREKQESGGGRPLGSGSNRPPRLSSIPTPAASGCRAFAQRMIIEPATSAAGVASAADTPPRAFASPARSERTDHTGDNETV